MSQQYTVWHRENDESQWVQDVNGRGERVIHSLNSAIKCQRYYERSLNHDTKREPVEP